jgi:hypothetical protein
MTQEFNNDLVFERDEKNNIICGGYKINHTMPLVSVNKKNSNDTQQGGSIGNMLNNLAVPAGLFMLQQSLSNNSVSNTYKNIESEVVDTSLYNKLVDLVSDKKKFNKSTRRNKHKKSNKKTIKNKTRKNK